MTAPRCAPVPPVVVQVQQFETILPGVPESVAQARRWARQALGRAGLPAEVVDDAVTCVSELATNALRHTHSGDAGGQYRIALEAGPGYAHLEVADQGGDDVPDVHLGGSETGRGLWIVAQLTKGRIAFCGGPDGRRVLADLMVGPRPTGARGSER